jgi:hypothetical protein
MFFIAEVKLEKEKSMAYSQLMAWHFFKERVVLLGNIIWSYVVLFTDACVSLYTPL